MVVSEAALAAGGDDDLLAIVEDFNEDFPGLGILDNRAERHVDVRVLPVGAVLVLASARFAVFSDDVAGVLKVQQRPILSIASDNHMPSASTVTAIGSALRRHPVAHEMRRAGAALARAAANLDVINEVLARHAWGHWFGMAACKRSVISSMVPMPSTPVNFPCAA